MADTRKRESPEISAGEQQPSPVVAGGIDQSAATPLRRRKKAKRAARQVPVFSQEVSWESGMRVYDEGSFERLRMPRAPHWSVVWSDLMMTMFILFAVLYIYQSSQKEIIPGEGPGFDFGTNVGSGVMGTSGGGIVDPFAGRDENGMTQIYDVSQKALTDANLGEFARVNLAPDKTVRIILTGDLLFDSGNAEIRPDAFASLDKIVPLVDQTPYMINVVGHTDDVPIHTPLFPSNWELSLVRASRVARFLMEKTGIGQERFSVTGHASFAPIAPNDSPANRAANRRVEIVLTRDKPATAARAGEIDER
ncbi:MAG: flagellar motor protein MotB [Pseudomonadota bacterium]